MKVLAINGSPRKNGNTAMLIDTVLEQLQKKGIKTQQVQLGGKKIHGCTACMKCFKKKDKHCVIGGDVLNPLVDKMLKADGIIIGSPTYFANVSSEVKALIDRAGLVAIANGLKAGEIYVTKNSFLLKAEMDQSALSFHVHADGTVHIEKKN